MALSAVSAAIVFLWRRQDRREARTERETEIKNAVNAVWVAATYPSEPRPVWGVLITNNLQSPIANVAVECSGNSESGLLTHPAVQPGKHFFQSLPRADSKAWALPTSSITDFEYITASKKHRTERISFTYSGAHYSKTVAESS